MTRITPITRPPTRSGTPNAARAPSARRPGSITRSASGPDRASGRPPSATRLARPPPRSRPMPGLLTRPELNRHPETSRCLIDKPDGAPVRAERGGDLLHQDGEQPIQPDRGQRRVAHRLQRVHLAHRSAEALAHLVERHAELSQFVPSAQLDPVIRLAPAERARPAGQHQDRCAQPAAQRPGESETEQDGSEEPGQLHQRGSPDGQQGGCFRLQHHGRPAEGRDRRRRPELAHSARRVRVSGDRRRTTPERRAHGRERLERRRRPVGMPQIEDDAPALVDDHAVHIRGQGAVQHLLHRPEIHDAVDHGRQLSLDVDPGGDLEAGPPGDRDDAAGRPGRVGPYGRERAVRRHVRAGVPGRIRGLHMAVRPCQAEPQKRRIVRADDGEEAHDTDHGIGLTLDRGPGGDLRVGGVRHERLDFGGQRPRGFGLGARDDVETVAILIREQADPGDQHRDHAQQDHGRDFLANAEPHRPPRPDAAPVGGRRGVPPNQRRRRAALGLRIDASPATGPARAPQAPSRTAKTPDRAP